MQSPRNEDHEKGEEDGYEEEKALRQTAISLVSLTPDGDEHYQYHSQMRRFNPGYLCD